MKFKDIWDIFSIPTSINSWTIGLIIFLILSFLAGYYLMASQVKLVKKEFWKWNDTLKCIIFAFFFGNGLTIVATTIVTFILDLNDWGYQDQAVFLLIPLIFCLTFISIYPLIEFLFMAHFSHEISTTPFQQPFEKLIKYFSKPWSYVLAIIIYGLAIVLPPVLLTLVFHVKFIIAWLSWQLIYPMVIILYYASVGYIIAFGIFTISLPHLPRSTFLHFDQSNRAIKEFFRDPMTYIVYGTLFYSYIYFIYRTVATISRFDINYVPYTVSWYNVDWSIPISLALAITAYFNRYWKRKVKSSTQSILFSTFLIAAMGINIMLNYLIARPYVFQELFMKWDITATFYDLRGINKYGNRVELYTELNLIGVIEEFMLFVIISYFFFIQKNHKAIRNAFIGTVTSAEEKFNPIPGFNMIRYQPESEQKFAYESLERMYLRIPNKRGLSFDQDRFIDPLFDALSDRTFIYGYYWSQKLFTRLMIEYPEKFFPLVEIGLKSENPDMVTSILECFSNDTLQCLQKINEDLFLSILSNRNHFHKELCLQILFLKYTSNDMNQKLSSKLRQKLLSLLNYPDYNVQGKVLRILSAFPDQVDHSIFISRLNDPHPQIQEAVARIAGEIATIDIESLSISKLIEMTSSVNPKTKAIILETLAKIGDFEKNHIPIDIFKDHLFDHNISIRNAAFLGLKSYLQEKPFGISIDYLLNAAKGKSFEIQKLFISLFPYIWKQAPSKVLSVLKLYIKSNDGDFAGIAQSQLIEMAQQDPKFIVSELIKESDTESILTRGKIVQTVLNITKQFPNQIIPLLIQNISSKNDNSKINAVRVLSDYCSIHSIDISPKTLFNIWKKESSDKIKIELLNIIKSVNSTNLIELKPFLNDLLKTFKTSSKSLRISIAKMISSLVKQDPNLISMKFINTMINDVDSSVREQGYTILGIIGGSTPKKAISILMKGLKEDDFSVKNTCLKSLVEISLKSHDTLIFSNLLKLLEDPNKWTRKSILNILGSLDEDQKKMVNIKSVLERIHISTEDEEVLLAFVKWIGTLNQENFNLIFPIFVKLMADPKETIRNAAISALVRLSRKIDSEILIPQLLSHLSDESPIQLEESVVLALKRIVKYERKEIKDRVIAILSIRAHHTQNKIMQAALSELKKK